MISTITHQQKKAQQITNMARKQQQRNRNANQGKQLSNENLEKAALLASQMYMVVFRLLPALRSLITSAGVKLQLSEQHDPYKMLKVLRMQLTSNPSKFGDVADLPARKLAVKRSSLGRNTMAHYHLQMLFNRRIGILTGLADLAVWARAPDEAEEFRELKRRYA